MTETQTRKVEKYHYKDYLSRAEQCLRTAKDAQGRGDWDACAINAVQSAISASDALSTSSLGLRSADQSHDDAIRLFRSIDPTNEAHKTNTNRLSRILSEKSASSYGEQSVKKIEGEYLLFEAERLLSYVKSKLPA